MPLSKAQKDKMKTAVEKASDNYLDIELNKFSNFEPNWPYLSKTSVIGGYKAKRYVKKLYDSRPTPIQTHILASYLSHSIAMHTFDGWKYLSQALLALMTGNRNKAIHLAYYAELRAAMAVLSSTGIAVCNSHHFSIGADGKVRWFHGATHEVTWEALSVWATVTENATRVLNSLSVLGLRATDWSEVCSFGSKLDITTKWLKDWSVDLKAIGEDRIVRNQVSYSCDLSTAAFESLKVEEAKLLHTICNSTIEVNEGTIPDFDLEIIRDMIEVFRANSDVSDKDFWDYVSLKLNDVLSLSPARADQLIGIVRNGPRGNERDILDYAKSGYGTDAGPQNVICRALLLLRLATSLLRSKWSNSSGISPYTVPKWKIEILESLMRASQLAELNLSLDDYLDVGSDERSVIDTFATKLNQLGDPICGHTLIAEFGRELLTLCQMERVAVRAIA